MKFCFLFLGVIGLASCKTTKENVTVREYKDSLAVTSNEEKRIETVMSDSLFSQGEVWADSIVVWEFVHHDSVKMPELKATWKPAKKITVYGYERSTVTKATKKNGSVEEEKKENQNIKVTEESKTKEKKSKGWRNGDWIMMTVVTAFISFVLYGLWKKR